MRHTLRTVEGDLVVISRRQAADTGYTMFYTGKPCKHGHSAPRYVTTGGCSACLKSMYRPRVNPWTTRLTPFSNNHLWTATHFSKAQRVALRVYLQKCIFEFTRANLEGLDFNARAEVQAAMQEIEERAKWVTAEDPRNTD